MTSPIAPTLTNRKPIDKTQPTTAELVSIQSEAVRSSQCLQTEAIDYGIDLNLLELNLELSPQQRIEQHESALALVQELRKAGDKLSKV